MHDFKFVCSAYFLIISHVFCCITTKCYWMPWISPLGLIIYLSIYLIMCHSYSLNLVLWKSSIIIHCMVVGKSLKFKLLIKICPAVFMFLMSAYCNWNSSCKFKSHFHSLLFVKTQTLFWRYIFKRLFPEGREEGAMTSQ